MHAHLHPPDSWLGPLGLACLLLVVAICYSWGWWRCRNAFPGMISISRLLAFVSGLLFIWIAVGSPLGSLDHRLLTAHMVQHLLLMAGAAPLILLGAPAVPFLHFLPQSILRGVATFSSQRYIRSFGRALTKPAFCLCVSSLTLLVWHIPAVFALAMRSSGLHVVQQASFFVAGILFWWPVIQPWPSVARSPRWMIPLYLFFATLPCDALSAFLTFCDRSVYPAYQNGTLPFGLSALSDQQLAGSLMWVCVTFIYLLPAVAITVHILAPSHRHQTTSNEEKTKLPRLGTSGLGVA